MEIKILWTDFAKSAVRSIYDYYLEHVSRNLARKLVIRIVAETKQLQYQPTMGTLEPLLEKDPRDFVIFYTNPTKLSIGLMKTARLLKLWMSLILVKILLKLVRARFKN